jgi:Tfp pilus assembly protein FimT
MELFITILVMAILLGIGVPSYMQFRQDNILLGAAQSLYSDIQFARSEAIKRSTDSIVVHMFNNNSNWCYQVSDNPSCSSCGNSSCDINGDLILRGASAATYPGSSVSTAVLDIQIRARRMSFTSAATITFTNSSGKQINVTTDSLGRVFMCTPVGASGVTGVEQCT